MQVNTIQSFSGEEAIAGQYVSKLEKSVKSETSKGVYAGLGFGFFMLCMFSSYGLAFIYGAEQVATGWDAALVKYPNDCGFASVGGMSMSNMFSSKVHTRAVFVQGGVSTNWY